MGERAPAEILVGPEDAERSAQIAAGEAPRLDYCMVAELAQGRVHEWAPGPAAIRGPKPVRVLRSFASNLGRAAGFLADLPSGAVVYSTGETWGLPVAVAASLSSRRRHTHVVYVHDVYSPMWQWMLRIANRQGCVHGWICVTKAQAGALRAQFGDAAPGIAVISQGVDVAFFDPGKAERPVEPCYLLSVGGEMRNYPLLLDAVAGLDLPVRIKASSSWISHTARPVSSLDDKVKFIDRRLSYHELRNLYAGAGLVVLPLVDTWQAAGTTSILEAMAMGKCVVATRSHGLPDCLVDGETGIVAEPEPGALRDAIQRLWEDGALRERLARQGRDLVRSGYALEHHAQAVAAFLSETSRQRG